MITLKTTFDSGADDDQDITILNLSARELPLDEALGGLGFSPGLLVVLPRGGSHIFDVDSGIVEVDQNGGVIVSGYSRARLSYVYRDYDDSPLRVLSIGAVINEASRLKDLLQLPCLIDNETTNELSRLHRALMEAKGAPSRTGSGKDLTKHLIAGQIVNTLMQLSKRPEPDVRTLRNDSSQLDRLKKFLFANLHRKITTVDMAAVVGLSRDHFCVWAKSQLGKPPARFLRELRMERSLDRLLNSKETIESIAEQIGYADRYHFGKEFKKYFGASPARLRKEHATKDKNFVSRVETLLTLFRHADAQAVCEEGLQADGMNPVDQNQLKLLYGHCLKGAEDYSKAMTIWEQLNHTDLGWQAGILRCQLAFEYDHVDAALAEMARLWSLENANHDELIQVWIQHVTILCTRRCSHALRKYLDVRRDHFIDNEASRYAALSALRGIGSDVEILEQCSSLRDACFMALRRCGLYDRAIAEYGTDVHANRIARIHLEVGDYARVLNTKPLDPRYCAQAMTEMGLPGDAIQAFPEHSARAYLKLKKYAELLEAIPDMTGETVYARIALGRLDELRESLVKGSYFYMWAQCYLDPESILREKVPDNDGHLAIAQILTVFKWLTEGRREEALSLLNEMETVRSPNLWPWLQSGGVFLLVSVMQAFLGQEVDLDEDLGLICRNHRYLSRQTVYYTAGYLRGTIDADAFQNQPRKDGLFERWLFVRPLAHDLDGRHDDARKGYRKLIEKTTDFELEYLIRRRFAEWRLGVLAPDVSST